MERWMRPERFNTDPNSPDASKSWQHWFRTFSNFISSLTTPDRTPDKLNLLINFIAPTVFEFIVDCPTYESAIETLQTLFVKPKNEIFARHILATSKQEQGQPLDQFLQKLRSLSKECDFKAVSAEKNKEEAIRDAFISGLISNQIRQRLLENRSLDLQTAFDLARSLEMAEQQSQTYYTNPVSAAVAKEDSEEIDTCGAVSGSSAKCFFCGYSRHPRSKCPAKDALCKGCGKQGHFQKMCLSSKSNKNTNKFTSAMHSSSSINASFSAAAPGCLSKATIDISINNTTTKALVDTGSSDSFMCPELASKLGLKKYYSIKKVSMASTNHCTTSKGHCFATFKYQDTVYRNIRLSLMPGLCSDVLLGHDFLNQHKSLEISFKGSLPTLSVCGVAAAKVETPSLFANLDPDCKPIATRSRRFSQPDKAFIDKEISRLLKEDIIEPSNSSWRAQVLVTSNERQKKRLVVDYSQTINKYTYLDAYPLPKIDEMINDIAQFEVFSTLDLKSAYHQVPLQNDDKHFTAFEAAGNLYQFKRVPFGVTNGVACFQRIIDNVIRSDKLQKTYAYLDNVTICGQTKEEHDRNLENFLACAKKHNITFNDDKSIIAKTEITLLGYLVSKGSIKPDPERLTPLRNLPEPDSIKSQKRVIGLFSYYSAWIPKFSDKIHSLVTNTTFPVPANVKSDFNLMKSEIEDAVIVTIDHSQPLVVETDASDFAIAATLNQNGRPVAFFSRTLNNSEKNHSSVEKEAYAIVESLRKWRHYLIGRHFKLVTDQQSVSFMYDNKKKSKVKNDKIQRWKIEMSCFKYDIVYRPGEENAPADTLSHAFCGSATSNNNTLYELHESLCHPGVTRMLHFVKSKNLPYSVEEIKDMTSKCRICCEMKPTFYKNNNNHLIKATQPLERLSVDFKGPLPSVNGNKYILTMIDEFSRFPFAFPCKDMCTNTVIKCFIQLFTTFGMPAFVHSDRGPSFMSDELKQFLHSKGIATSRTTAYNPKGNGQVERLNGTVWKTVNLALKAKGLSVNQWESVLPDALHAIRSLLCTATNETPHERLFKYNRKSATGTTLPNWLSSPGRVLMKRNVRSSKYDPLVDEVDLLDCNPLYAHVRLLDGRETTVSLHQLAPLGEYGSSPGSKEMVLPDTLNPSLPEPSLEPSSTAQEPTAPSLPEVSPEQVQDNHNLVENVHDILNDCIVKEPFVRTRPYNLRNREA